MLGSGRVRLRADVGIGGGVVGGGVVGGGVVGGGVVGGGVVGGGVVGGGVVGGGVVGGGVVGGTSVGGSVGAFVGDTVWVGSTLHIIGNGIFGIRGKRKVVTTATSHSIPTGHNHLQSKSLR